jgi:UDP-N-acetylmuramate dehydrogenase
MITAGLAGRLRDKGFTGALKEAEPLSRYVSLKVGGPTALFAAPETVGEILVLLNCLGEESVPWVLLGGGTNTVFANGGYRGCVVRLGGQFSRCELEGDSTVLAGAAASLPVALTTAAEKGLTGMECLAGIPGTVGGAVFMNAGTSRGEISDVVHEVRLFDGTDTRWVPGEELGFSYRSSRIPEGNIILDARLKLKPSSREEVGLQMKALSKRRQVAQPSGVASAGCWFRNPEGDSAGRLIDAAGMKGEKCGGAQVSEVHANFLVNRGGATTADFLTLADRVKGTVHKRFGVLLQEEVRVVDE